MNSAEALVNQMGWPHMHHLFALICLVAVVYKVTILYLHRRHLLRGTEDFPGPPAHWLFGHFNSVQQNESELLQSVEWGRQYSYAFPVWFGPFVCLLRIQHPDYVKTTIAKADQKTEFLHRFIQSWIGEGLLLSKGQKWFRNRRLLTPAFHYDVLKPYTNLMAESAQTMLDKWESYANTGESFELFEHVSLMTLDTILKCAFSYSSNCQNESGSNAYIKAVYELSDLLNLRSRTFPYHNDLIFYLSPHGFRYRKACRVAHDHTEAILRKRKEELKKEKELERIQAKRNLDFLDILLFARAVIRKRKEELKEEKELERTQAKRKLDFLDILLLARDENQQGLSDEDIRAEVDTFMFAGHDTTASGLSFILYCLACHPEHQKMCREEIIQALDGKDTMEWEDLSKIPYTTMCIKECLRLYPPVPIISRKTTKAMTFSDGRTVPKGSSISIFVFGIHRNPTVWENPDVFDPLRFLPENASKRSPHAFIPFSAGSRNCIGQNFAMNELKVVTALTLRRYHLIEDPTQKPKLIPRLVLRSLNGIHIKIKPVDPQE